MALFIICMVIVFCIGFIAGYEMLLAFLKEHGAGEAIDAAFREWQRRRS